MRKDLADSTGCALSIRSLSLWAIFRMALLGLSCMTASAGEVQRLDRLIAMEVAFHEKAPVQDLSRGGVIAVDSDAMRLITEVGRIVVESGDAATMPPAITAQFAVQPPDQPPSDVLTISMDHAGDGIYLVADGSRSAMGDWFVEREGALLAGNLVLLRIDGFAAGQSDAAVRFDIEGECAICGSIRSWH